MEQTTATQTEVKPPKPMSIVVSGPNTYDNREIIKALGKATFDKTTKSWMVVFYDSEPVRWPAGRHTIPMKRRDAIDRLRAYNLTVEVTY